MGDNLGTLLLKDKQVRILSALMNRDREWHLTDLARETGVTYVHISKFIKRCEESGLIDSDRRGRVKILVLTELGQDIARSAIGMLEKINSVEKPQAQHQQK